MSATKRGWDLLLDGFPWFEGEGHFPLPAYSEFTPAPIVGRTPYGAAVSTAHVEGDPLGWHISEIEEEDELRPGMEDVAQHIVGALVKLGRGEPVYPIAGHQQANLQNNPCWSPELAKAGQLAHERYVVLMPLALSRTQDDMGRIRWTLFGGSEQGPERAFWKGFYTAPDQEWSQHDSLSFIARLLTRVYNESIPDPKQLKQAGFRILPSKQYPAKLLPSWTRPFVCDGRTTFSDVHYLLTFKPFDQLPEVVRQRYLNGLLHLLPCPHSLVFWGMPTYRRLSRALPLAMQIPLQRLLRRRGGPDGLRIPQTGWLHEPHPDLDPATIQKELLHDTYVRTSRWHRAHRYEDELALNPRADKVSKVLFSTALDVMGLYDKPMARNCQIWTQDFRLLLDGPNATPGQLRRAEGAVTTGGLFGYRFMFPAMRVGLHEVYWQRPLVAFSNANGQTEVIHDAPPGYFTAYRSDKPDLSEPIELWPRIMRREADLAALHRFEGKHDHYRRQTALNILSLLDSRRLLQRPLSRSLARYLLRISTDESLETWLKSLRERTTDPHAAELVENELRALLEPSEAKLPDPITFGLTANRAFEEAWWKDIAFLAHGKYINKDNADVVRDTATESRLAHPHRDLDALGDYLIERYQKAISEAGMEGQALCGDLPFRWQTDFDFPLYDGWLLNKENRGEERDILVVIPGKNRGEAVVMADHYDTAYMEDAFEAARGGSGARLAAAGADDNHSATATLLLAAPIFLKMAKEGRLERDVWLLHLTGEEFPADCLGARHFSQMLVEKRLKLRSGRKTWHDLASTRVVGLLVMDMIGHNRDNAHNIFQISPGRSVESLLLAEQAHLANMIWNAGVRHWNDQPDRRGKGPGRRSADGITIPAVARHPSLHGEVRTARDPQSSLYNTDGQIFSDVGVPAILFMEDYDINRTGYHDTHDTLENIDLDYGSAVAAIAIEAIARMATLRSLTANRIR